MEKEKEENKIPVKESDTEMGAVEDGKAPVEAKESEDIKDVELSDNGDMGEPDVNEAEKKPDVNEAEKKPDVNEAIAKGPELPVEENEPELPVEENEPESAEEKMLTQSQVNELVGKARAEGRASAMKELYGRYGVSDDNEMNDIFGRGQGYDILNDEYNVLNGKYGELAAENALLKTQIVPSRWDDVKAILRSKGMEVSVDNIGAELTTHPEWKNNAVAKPEVSPDVSESQVSQVRKLGSNVPESKVEDEETNSMRWFGLE